MDAVLGILGHVLGIVSQFCKLALDFVSPFSVYIFLVGFFGILFTFLWFFFRYLDRKKLALQVILFILFFLIFLGGSTLLLLQDTGRIGHGAAGEPVEEISAEAGSAKAI